MSSKTEVPTQQRWAQIEALFDAVLELPHGERDAFLKRSCGGDDGLRQEVEALIVADESGGRRVEGLIGDAVGKALADTASGGMLGPYRIVDTIGQGGMGVVYRARREDHEFEQEVAIKLLHKTLVTSELQQRFRSERQILANLNHPNIAHLIDGGSSEEGVPYLVMEYVEGLAIDVYCDLHGLSVRKRLDLFRQVCFAVEFAHQNLIVHRDIKPGNILVTADGTPKLLDFGIAKILSPQAERPAQDLTQIGERLLTPDHASPEQMLTRPVTTASDVYSLGVLLYELLCGHRPFRLNGLSPAAMERLICETEPERPSRAIATQPAPDGRRVAADPKVVARNRGVSPERLRRQLAGDLDTIVLYALRKEPHRRYRSVGLMSDDLRRHLRGLPVTAQHDTFTYRTAKFIARNRLGVGLGATLVLFLAGFAVVTAIQAKRIAEERDVAQQSMSFLTEMFTATDPEENLGREVTAREIFDRGAERANEQLEDQPAMRMVLQETIGQVYRSLGLYAEALTNLRSSLATREAELGSNDASLVPTLNLIGSVLRDKGDWEESERTHRHALAIATAHHGSMHIDIAESQASLAETLVEMDRLEEAETEFRTSLAIFDDLGDAHEAKKADVQTGLARLLRREGHFDQAEAFFREALRIYTRLNGPSHPVVANMLENLALTLQSRGDLDAAGPLYEQALAIFLQVYGNDHLGVALAKYNMGRYRHNMGQYAEAERLFRESLAIETKLRGPDHQWTVLRATSLAATLRAQGRLDEAERLYVNAVATYESTLGGNHAVFADALRNLGDLRREQGQLEEGLELLTRALNMLIEIRGPGHWHIAACQSDLAALHADWGHSEIARDLLAGAVRDLTTGLGTEHRLTRLAIARWEGLPAEGP